MDKNAIPKATLGRLPMYLEFLTKLPAEQTPYISATTIAKKLCLGDVQVRKDLNRVSGAGRPKVGYVTADLIYSIEQCLGNKQPTNAVIVGAGRLGKALLGFDDFEHYGVNIVAAFDNNEEVLQQSGDKKILPVEQLHQFCKGHGVRIGIITVDEASAQEICEKMIASGIRAIWNFAPCRLVVPGGVIVKQEVLAASLAHLNNQLFNM